MTPNRWIAWTAIICATAATPAHATDFVRFTCLPSVHTLIIETSCVGDDVYMDKNDGYEKVVFAEMKKQQTYPLQRGTTFNCKMGDDYKFEIVKGDAERDKVRLWYNDRLLLDMDSKRFRGSSFTVECPTPAQNTVDKITIDRLGNLHLVWHRWEKEMKESPIGHSLHGVASDIYISNVVRNNEGWPFTDKNIDAMAEEGIK